MFPAILAEQGNPAEIKDVQKIGVNRFTREAHPDNVKFGKGFCFQG